MTCTYYVVDTSYLCEFYGVDGACAKTFKDPLRQKIIQEFARGSVFVVPLHCIFELGNHIAHVRNKHRARELSQALFEAVEKAISNSGDRLWTITPADDLMFLPDLCRGFHKEYVQISIGLTDAFIIREALRLKNERKSSERTVHIWSKDRSLKAHEPDSESDPPIPIS